MALSSFVAARVNEQPSDIEEAIGQERDAERQAAISLLDRKPA
jgi:hypothetical protein